jgi:GT2 family glycosyltransferase
VRRIAVSILNFNSAAATVACVRSLLRTLPGNESEYSLEIFVADNGSVPPDRALLQETLANMDGVRLARHSENLGFAAGHNRNLRLMLSRSRPDYVWLLNSDCVVESNAVLELVRCAERNPQVALWGATLLEADGKRIQCAGGCRYNSWLSTYRRLGRGRRVSARDRLPSRQLDYVAGASLFFPLSTLTDGLAPAPGESLWPRQQADHWLNEEYFLYFEELDLAHRLKPNRELGWCREALIRHEGGVSAGTRKRQRSAMAEYHSTLSVLKYTYFYYPRRLPLVAAGRFVLKSLLLVSLFKWRLLKPLTRAYRDFSIWRSRAERATGVETRSDPLVTVVVPSLNQGRFLEKALASIFAQDVPVEVFVMDGGSTDNSLDVIRKWESKLAGWRSRPDEGQAAAINEGMARGSAPYVCWLNSDDLFGKDGLRRMIRTMQGSPTSKFAYGRCWTISEKGRRLMPYITMPFSPRLFANFCFIAQPATIIRRDAWESAGGLNEGMHLAFDYDLWWRLMREYDIPTYCRDFVASTRMHGETKTANLSERHYAESIAVVKRNWKNVPIKWSIGLPLIKLFRRFTV